MSQKRKFGDDDEDNVNLSLDEVSKKFGFGSNGTDLSNGHSKRRKSRSKWERFSRDDESENECSEKDESSEDDDEPLEIQRDHHEIDEDILDRHPNRKTQIDFSTGHDEHFQYHHNNNQRNFVDDNFYGQDNNYEVEEEEEDDDEPIDIRAGSMEEVFLGKGPLPAVRYHHPPQLLPQMTSLPKITVNNINPFTNPNPFLNNTRSQTIPDFAPTSTTNVNPFFATTKPPSISVVVPTTNPNPFFTFTKPPSISDFGPTLTTNPNPFFTTTKPPSISDFAPASTTNVNPFFRNTKPPPIFAPISTTRSSIPSNNNPQPVVKPAYDGKVIDLTTDSDEEYDEPIDIVSSGGSIPRLI